jgi:sulfatase modifying factor 1
MRPSSSRIVRLGCLPVLAASSASCGAPSTSGPAAPVAPAASASAVSNLPAVRDDAGEGGSASSIPIDAGAPDAVAPEPADEPCPPDMVHVTHDFCPKVERTCRRREYNKPNRITICHSFAPGSTRCLAPRVKLDFCIDKYEYPNREGAHPPWMVSWFDAEATCRNLGKRTCWDYEWVAACEGPDETPFPYGWDRDNTRCNIDNTWIEPRLKDAYSSDPAVSLRELSRLDQSVPSGSMKGCVSGYGVFDLTGNMDEWVTRAERNDHEKSAWAGLKGGAWGHVRNACRPMTTSHPPDFTYYFITFRCCKEPRGVPPFVPPGASPPPTVTPADKAPIPRPIDPPGPSKQKVPPQNRGR